MLSCLLLALFGAPEPALVEGKFGKALDAARTPLAFGGDHRYRTPPITVECWAKLNGRRGFNVLVSCDDKASARHWELYTYDRTGRLAVYVPGYEPSEVVSKTDVCDGKWRYLAFTFDGKSVTLFADGKAVHTQAIKPRAGMKPKLGPLCVGMAIDGDGRIGCDGVIDDVRLSRIVRPIKGVPAAPLAVDADTTALWPFDDGAKVLADPAWTPPPKEVGEAWERMTDVDWVDTRLRKMDTGPTFNGTLAYQHGKDRVLVYKGTAIRIGDKGEGGVIFDRNQLRLAAGWVGGYLTHSDRRFGLINTPTPAGTMRFSTRRGVGWAEQDSGSFESKYPPTAPLPHRWGRYNGLFMNGKRAVLSYTVGDTEVLESPWLEDLAGEKVITRTLTVGPGKKGHRIGVGVLPSNPTFNLGESMILAHVRAGGNDHAIFVQGAGKDALMLPEKASIGRPGPVGVELLLRASDEPRNVRIVQWSGTSKAFEAIVAALLKLPAPDDLRAWKKPGPSRWPVEIVTRGEVAKDTAPYVVDTLTIPYKNPYNALFFCTGLDFLPDGRLAVCTCHGDVWTVRFDPKLEKVAWRRYATGLYHPLGLKVVDGKVVVLERGQLTRLHGDDEAYRYENLCHDWHTGAGEHSYDTCLETDADGNFYFFKTGDTELPHGGCLLRASKDGKKVEVFATGFRHPIGLGVSPAGEVTGADQEGNWMPVTRLDIYRKGGFYGDMRAHHRATPPKTYDGPLLWLPKDVDNSAGGQAWVPHDRFGLPKGQMLHFSYGRCKLYAVHRQKVGDVEQGSAVDLGVFFLSGSARGRFHPTDGALYVCGLNGWQTAARRDGCLQRVRYTGAELPFATGHEVYENGVRLRFARKLDAAAVAKGWAVEQWGYRWSADYGSKRWSVIDPKRQGTDRLEVTAATLEDGGRSVFLTVKGLRPAMQMRIAHAATKTLIHSTVHRLAPAEKR